MKGENALIYGATGGLGQAISNRLLEKGVNLFLIGRSETRLSRMAAELKLGSAQFYCSDSITSEKELNRAKAWLREKQITIKYGIHAAGEGLMKPASKLTLAEWNRLLDVNLTSAFAFFQLCHVCCSESGYELTYFSSASLNQAWPKNGLYGASKAGLEAFVQSLQKEIKSEGGRVWLYRAGSIRTGFFDRVKNHLPLEKMLKAEEVAEIVVNNFQTAPGIYFPLIPLLSE